MRASLYFYYSTNSASGQSIGIGYAMGGSQNGFTLDASVNQGRGHADGAEVVNNNTHVNAGGTASIASGGDTNLKGAVVSGKTVTAEVGGNLNVESLQDMSSYDSKQTSSGAGVSLCIPPFCYGASTVSGSVGKSTVNGDFKSVTEQSGIQAGDGGFQVDVKGNTDLKGGVIASSDHAIIDGKNSLATGTLTTSDLHNTDSYAADAFNVNASFSGKMGDQGGAKTVADKAAANAPSLPGGAAGFGSAGGDQASTTASGISGGAVIIRDDAGQQALTGQSADQAVAGVNRDVATGKDAGALKRGWNGAALDKDVNAQVAITQAFGQVAAKEIGDYADKQEQAARASGDKEAEANWAEGGAYRVAAHTAAGASGGGLAGALGAGTSAAAMPEIGKRIDDMDLPDPVKQALSAASAAAIGGLVGGGVGAGAAFNTDANNRQLHPTEVKWIKDNAARFAAQNGISVTEAEERLAQQSLKNVDYLWRAQLSDGDDAAAKNFLASSQQTFVNDLGQSQKLFTATGQQLFRPEMFADTSDPAFYKQFAQSGISRSLTTGLLKEARDSGLDIKNGAIDLAKAARDNPGLAVTAVWDAVKSLPQGVVDGFKETGGAIGEGAAVALNQDLTDKLNAIYGTDVAGAQKALLAIRLVAATTGAAGTAKATAGLSEAAAAAVGKKLDDVLDNVARDALIKGGGVVDKSGNALLDMSKLTSNQKGVMGDLFGADTVKQIVPGGEKLARIPGIGETGLDDLYKVNRPGVDYVVIEYKFVGTDAKTGASALGKTQDGLQGAESWITGSDRIERAVGRNAGREVREAVDAGRIESWVVTTRPDGSTELQVLDSLGKVKPIDTSKIILPKQNLSGAHQ